MRSRFGGGSRSLQRHCEERSDEAIQTVSEEKAWIASLPLAMTELVEPISFHNSGKRDGDGQNLG
jgi:hypothetical protein